MIDCQKEAKHHAELNFQNIKVGLGVEKEKAFLCQLRHIFEF